VTLCPTSSARRSPPRRSSRSTGAAVWGRRGRQDLPAERDLRLDVRVETYYRHHMGRGRFVLGSIAACMLAAAGLGAAVALAGTTTFTEIYSDSTFTTTTTTVPRVPPDPPTLTGATAAADGVHLSWRAGASTGTAKLSGVHIYRATGNDPLTPFATLGLVDTYTDTTTVNGTRYVYAVSVFSVDGESSQSNSLSVVATGPFLPGLFQPYQAYPVGSFPDAVAIGDVTGDGRKDVVMTTDFYFDPNNDYHLFVFAQQPDGTLAPPVSYPLGMQANRTSVAVGDITGDGRADVVVGIDRTAIEVFPQIVGGTLGSPVVTATIDSSLIRLGRLDGNTRLDIAGIGFGTNTASVFLDNGTGGLRAPAVYPVPHDGYDDLEIADVTGDGRADLVVMSGQGLVPNLSVLAQLAGGGFGPATSYSVGGNVLTNGIGVGDVTGDGRADVVASYGGNKPGSNLAVFAQNATGALAAPVSYPSLDIPEPVEVADFDLDGRADVAVAHGGWNSLGIYLQQPGGTLAAEALYPIPYATHYGTHGLAVGDVNGDGAPEVVLADYNHGLIVLRNTTPPGPTADVPGAPHLTAATAGNANVQLSWDPPTSNGGSPLTGYRIYRGTAPGDETMLADVGLLTSWTDTTAVNGTTYFYEISALNRVGEGPISNELSATPKLPDPTPPSKPANLKLAVAGTSQLILDWSPSTDNVGVTGYELLRKGVVVATVTRSQALDGGLAPNTSYSYQVRALDAAGNRSALSNTVTAKTVQVSGSNATLAGAVFDPTGAPLDAVTVKVTVGNSVKSAKTNGSGVWKIGGVPAGTYTITVSRAGRTTQTFGMTATGGATVLSVAILTPA